MLKRLRQVRASNFKRFFAKRTVAADGENSRESLPCVFATAICVEWSYIGTRHTVSADATSKSKVTWIRNEAID